MSKGIIYKIVDIFSLINRKFMKCMLKHRLFLIISTFENKSMIESYTFLLIKKITQKNYSPIVKLI